MSSLSPSNLLREVTDDIREDARSLDSVIALIDQQEKQLALVAWYFNQRQYSISPVGRKDPGCEPLYYLHHSAPFSGRYAKLIKMDSGEDYWPSIAMALAKAKQLADSHPSSDEGAGS